MFVHGRFLHALRRYTDAPIVTVSGAATPTSLARTRSTSRKYATPVYHLPAIVVEDLSLDKTLSGPVFNLSAAACGDSPLRRPCQSPCSNIEESPKFWLDEDTLVNTPRSARICADTKWVLGSSSLNVTPTSLAPKFSTTSTPVAPRRFSKPSHGDLCLSLDSHSAASAVPQDTSANQHKHGCPREAADPAQDVFVIPPKEKRDGRVRLPPLRAPESNINLPESQLRRRARRADLRSAYQLGAGLHEHATRCPAVPREREAESFEQQITLAILHEMDRAPGGRTTQPRRDEQAQSGTGKGILRNLGTLVCTFGTHTTTGVVRI